MKERKGHWYRLAHLPRPLSEPLPAVPPVVAAALGDTLLEAKVIRRSLDARKKQRNLTWIETWELQTKTSLRPVPEFLIPANHSHFLPPRPPFLDAPRGRSRTVAVVGSGPAGLFAAWALASCGQKVVLIERGKPVETRMKDIGQLRSFGVLNPESNVCFGEGGAGTYTDGKLYTRVKHPYLDWLMAQFARLGEAPDLMVDAHPHLGTDRLVRLIARMREELRQLGVTMYFNERLEDLIFSGNRLLALRTALREVPVDAVFLGLGHSARETLERLFGLGFVMTFKPFAVGVRVEHPQVMINEAQYGMATPPPELGAASYRLAQQVSVEGKLRGVYSFCMCPGGFIVPTPTEPGHSALNGMSNANRSTRFANSGIVVQVDQEDLCGMGIEPHPLMGLHFQRQLERTCFHSAEASYHAPAGRLDDLVAGRMSTHLAPTRYRPGAILSDPTHLFPQWLLESLQQGMLAFDRKLKGFVSREANWFAVESRTSASVRLERGADFQALGKAGCYPIGEGAGYAGGIVSAALDGLKAAEAFLLS